MKLTITGMIVLSTVAIAIADPALAKDTTALPEFPPQAIGGIVAGLAWLWKGLRK